TRWAPLRIRGRELLAIDRVRIKPLRAVAKLELDRARLRQRHGAIKAGAAAGMTGARPALLNLDPDRVLVAVDAHLDDALHVARTLALAPQGAARTAVVPGVAARDRALQSFGVHVRDHQYVAGLRVGRHAGHQPFGVEFRRQ